MNNGNFFTETEWTEFRACYRELVDTTRDAFAADERTQIRKLMQEAIISGVYPHGEKGINLLLRNVHTVLILCEKIGHERNMLLSVLLYPLVAEEYITIEKIEELYGADTTKIIRGLIKANSLYKKHAAISNENFKKLLLTFAEDIRVIFIMIADRLCLMRMINHHRRLYRHIFGQSMPAIGSEQQRRVKCHDGFPWQESVYYLHPMFLTHRDSRKRV